MTRAAIRSPKQDRPILAQAGPDARPGLAARVAATALAILGTVILGVRVAVQLGGQNPRHALWFGIAAGTNFLLAAVLSRRSADHRLALRAWSLVGAGLSGLYAVSAMWQATERSGPRILLLVIPVGLLITTAVLAIRDADTQRRRGWLRAVRSRLDGEEAERRRWVRELHDETLQELAVVHVLLETAAASCDPDVQANGIAEAGRLVGRQIQALRRLISHMRPVALETLGLTAAFEDLATHAAEMSRITIQVLAEPLPRLAPETEMCVYRIVQEGLNNAIRHSGARQITIEARATERWLEVGVHDDGPLGSRRKFVPGHGLLGMKERAESIGAQLRITAGDPTGTVVHLKVPR